jgi:hypothetical protein
VTHPFWKVAKLLQKGVIHLRRGAMFLPQGVQHLEKGARHLAWKIHPLAQVLTWPGNKSPHYCAVARLRGCAVARLRGCAVARLRGCAVARLRGCAVAPDITECRESNHTP